MAIWNNFLCINSVSYKQFNSFVEFAIRTILISYKVIAQFLNNTWFSHMPYHDILNPIADSRNSGQRDNNLYSHTPAANLGILVWFWDRDKSCDWIFQTILWRVWWSYRNLIGIFRLSRFWRVICLFDHLCTIIRTRVIGVCMKCHSKRQLEHLEQNSCW